MSNPDDSIYLLYLKVPYKDREEAKRLGARWSKDRKSWFLIVGNYEPTLSPFLPWIDFGEPTHNVWAPWYWLAENTSACWKCSGNTHVYGFLMPGGSEYVWSDPIGEEELGRPVSIWERVPIPSYLHYVDYLPTQAVANISSLTRTYFEDYSKTTQSRYFMNHCEHCGAKLGDSHLFCETDGAFGMMSEKAASRTKLYPINTPLVTSADYGLSTAAEYFLTLMSVVG